MSDAKNINEVAQITTVESADYLMVSDITDDSLKRATVEVVGETLLGTTDISSIGDGTVTGAISDLDEDVSLLDTTTATSESFALTGTSEGNALAHTLYGMSVQDGTPTPSSPVDIDSSVANFTCANSDSTESVTITTDLTLRAIEVTSSDDYNLVRDDKYYIADTVDWSEDDGYVLTRRIAYLPMALTSTGMSGTTSTITIDATLFQTASSRIKYGLCSCGTVRSDVAYWNLSDADTNLAVGELCSRASGTSSLQFYFKTAVSTAEEVEALISGQYIASILATPTTEPLTAEQAEALLSLKTYDTATSITCTADVAPTMELEYASGRVTALALTGHNEAELKVDWASENVLGAKNLNSTPYYNYYYNGSSYTTNGITFTLNSDGSITANGTASANATYTMHHRINTYVNKLVVPNGNYILSGCPSGGSELSTYCLSVARTYNGAYTQIVKEIGDGVEFTLNGDDYSDDEVVLYVDIKIYSGTTVNNLTFYPMIRPASVKDPTWVPYAMTNKELTDAVKCNQTTAGTYTLQATVDSSGNVTYSWV